ncbi:MAG: hypothetical protein HY541_09235, partial [Deltaproteobacteria bacterium]|nr:hypothetical protein [Deltaproteobacteria bacterium]
RLTHRLYWAFVRAALDHEIGEALEGRLNGSVRPMDKGFKERLDELRKLANSTLHSVQERDRTPETRRASTFLARAFRRMLISDTRNATSPLEKIMDEGTLIESKDRLVAKKLHALLTTINAYASATGENLEIESDRLCILVVQKLKTFSQVLQYFDRLKIEPGSLEILGYYYLQLFHEIVASLYRHRAFPADLDWNNFFADHTGYDSVFFPGTRSAREDTLARYFLSRFGRAFYAAKGETTPEFWIDDLGDVARTIGPQHGTNLKERTDLSALAQRGEVPASLFHDAQNFHRRSLTAAVAGEPLIIFEETSAETDSRLILESAATMIEGPLNEDTGPTHPDLQSTQGSSITGYVGYAVGPIGISGVVRTPLAAVLKK